MVSAGADADEPDPDRRSVLGGLTTGAILGTTAYAVPQPAAAASPSDIVMMDAASLESVIHSRKASCVEVMSAYLNHIEGLNAKVNAIVALQDRAQLLAQARERDAELARGESKGPLHGFPHAVKDLLPVKGIRSTWGSPLLKNFVPAADSLLVERLRNAGAIIIGKTNAPEFGLGSHIYNPVYGATLDGRGRTHGQKRQRPGDAAFRPGRLRPARAVVHGRRREHLSAAAIGTGVQGNAHRLGGRLQGLHAVRTGSHRGLQERAEGLRIDRLRGGRGGAGLSARCGLAR